MDKERESLERVKLMGNGDFEGTVSCFRAAFEIKIGVIAMPDKSGSAVDRSFRVLLLGSRLLWNMCELPITASAVIFQVSLIVMTVEIKVVREITRVDDFFKSILMQKYA